MKDDRHEQFADWITRYYSSHKYIPDGHSDGELIGKLIRCKDCKYYRWEIDMCNEPHSTAHNIVHEDDYCSRAERKEE